MAPAAPLQTEPASAPSRGDASAAGHAAGEPEVELATLSADAAAAASVEAALADPQPSPRASLAPGSPAAAAPAAEATAAPTTAAPDGADDGTEPAVPPTAATVTPSSPPKSSAAAAPASAAASPNTAPPAASQAAPAAAPAPPPSGPRITLLLTTGARHIVPLNARALQQRQVVAAGGDPWRLSVYELKELIWKDWADAWGTRPSSPSLIRLIHFGRMLDDKLALRDCRFQSEAPIVHMTVKPHEVTDDEDARVAKYQAAGDLDEERTARCRCAVM